MDRLPSNKRLYFREADLHGLGLDPTTARRLFVRHCGMTFHAYQRARRMGAALIDLRQHRDVPRAMDVGGYESFSGFGGAFAGIFGKPPSRASSVNVLLAERIATPLGPMVAIARDDELCLLEFHDRRALELEVAWLRHRHDAVVLPGTNDVLRQIACELEQYFRGERTAFATPVALAGSPFQVSVWRELSRIAPGETRSYAQIADAVGRPGALRAVGRANGENRVALVIPCHRVIRADGTTSGYGGGAWRKEWLLAHEQRRSRPFPAITPRAAQDAR